MSLLDKSDIRSAYSSASYTRGKRYYESERVRDLTMENLSAKECTIRANVQGTDLYQVMLHIQHKGMQTLLDGKCSCPLKRSCKHIVATLLEAIDQSKMRNALGLNATGSASHTPTTLPIIPKTSDHQLNYWFNQLQNALQEDLNGPPAVDETYELHYLLLKEYGKIAYAHIQPTLVRRLKSGALGASKNFSETAASHQKHLHPIDKELLVKLAVHKKSLQSHAYYSHYPLRDAAGEELFQAVIQTGRCHWGSGNKEAITIGQPQSTALEWVTNEKGLQTLSIQSDRQDNIFFIQKPWIYNQSTATCHPLQTGLPDKLTRTLLTAPQIAPEHAAIVSTFLKQHDKIAAVSSPNQLIQKEIKQQKPVPCLYLTQAPLRTMFYSNYEDEKAIAMLSFRYESLEVPWENTQEVIREVSGDSLLTVTRHKHFEMKTAKKLMQHQARLLSQYPELARIYVNQPWLHTFLIEHSHCDPLEFSAHVLPKLRKAGWQIEFAEDYPYQIIEEPIDDWYSAIQEESSEYDWFGLELGITVQGEQINLLPAFQGLIKQLKQRDIPEAKRDEPMYVQLPDGRYIPLPAERVNHILNILIELYDGDSLSEDQSLRLSKLHALRLLELEAAMGAAELRWVGGERLREVAQKLSQFSGIALAEPPSTFLATLRPYQQEGLSWLQFLREYEFGGILADEMGLGKTVQALAHISLEKSSGRLNAPCLVIAPTSLMFNWQMEAARFAPDLKVVMMHGAERKKHFEHLQEYDLILTTYPLIIRDKEALLKQAFYLLILDEAQCIKNAKSQSALIAMQIKATHRLCLTGTPMENHMGELWSLFHFMMPGLLGDQKSFQRLFRTPIEKHGDQARRQHLNRRIAPFLLRRTKDKVAQELPEKVEMIRHVELEGAQRDVYETIRITMQEKVKNDIAKLGLKRSHIIILDALLKLRQVCCDPRLLKIKTAKQKTAKSAKLDVLITLLKELLEEGRRIILFSQFTEMLALIEDAVTSEIIPYVKLTGQTQDRATPVKQFQAGEVPLFLISLKAGGTGLNLTAADTVIHYDPWWNPAVENQATDRAHRIGQNKTVFVYKLIAKSTVEEKILDMQQRKHMLMEGLFSDKTTSKMELTEQDLQGLFEPIN